MKNTAHSPSDFLPDRRRFLQSSSMGIGWLAFSAIAAASGRAIGSAVKERTHFPASAKRVIFMTMRGGPSHVDLLDYKPDLIKNDGKSAEIGKYANGAVLLGPVHPFEQFGKSGQWMSSLLPRIGEHADDICLINSMQTDLPNHSPAFVQMHTGSFQFVRPSLGAWTVYGLGSANESLPAFITLNPPADNGGARNYGSAFLPTATQGTRIGGSQLPDLYAALMKRDETPGPPMKNIENSRLGPEDQRDQLDLIRKLNEHRLSKDVHQPHIEGMIKSFELAFRMQSEVPGVVDLEDETEETREMYGIGKGKDAFARQCLLARRLAESGVRFIEIASPTHWDHHALLTQNLETACAAVDQPIGALLTDLKRLGLLEDTLVVWAGEFGRTPYAQGIDGRDHNHRGFSIWMAGGGVKGGLTYGATDELGHAAVKDHMHIHDWHATILHLLGLDHNQLTFNYGGRDFRLTDNYGKVAQGILS